MKQMAKIKTILEKLKPVLKKQFQVENIGVFGSFVREEQTSKSDIDIVVEFWEPNTIDLFDFLKLEEFLSKELEVKVDLVTKKALKLLIRDQILRETVYAVNFF